MKTRILIALFILLAALSLRAEDANEPIREAVRRHDLDGALALANQRLASMPTDWEALGWHARLIAWRGEWPQAEAEYRVILQHSPHDTDVLFGLADVLIWQHKFEPALEVLEQAEANGASESEVQRRRARVLSAVGRYREAKNAYRDWLAADSSSSEAQAALHSSGETRHELRVGNDTDTFNYTDAAAGEYLTLRSRWNPHWTTVFGSSFDQRFGFDAHKANVAVTYSFNSRNALTAGGAFGNRQDAVSRYDQFIAYDHGFRLHAGFLRGFEVSAEQHSLWFTATQVTLFGGTVIVYLPRDWQWSLTSYAARSHFDLAGNSWTPSGTARISFPVTRWLRANGSYSVGSEDFSNIDQIGRFSAHTYGGGARFQVTKFQDISMYGAWQDRTQNRTQTSFGVSYGIRF